MRIQIKGYEFYKYDRDASENYYLSFGRGRLLGAGKILVCLIPAVELIFKLKFILRKGM